jgi:hypothetical protein
MSKLIRLGTFVFFLSVSAQAQTFTSGSTGADGALDLTSGNQTVQLPESGVLNYTTVNIPAGRTLTFRRNSRNTPVYILAQGNVTIAGTINVNAGSDPDTPANGRTPGPGGFYGGASDGDPGFGPGGGHINPNNIFDPSANGSWVGPLSLVPIIGGSGGANSPCCSGGLGGGGGGAIVIASSTSIIVTGSSPNGIYANGGGGSTTFADDGSGGAIRLVANSINISGQLLAVGNCNPLCDGVIRLEAPSGALTFTGTSNPAAVLSPINPVVVSSTPPFLTIVSIGGFAVPPYAGQRFDTVDLLLPNQLTDPITVVVQGNNIPVGTPVSIGIVNGSPNATTTPDTLQGTFESSTASPTISNLNRTAVTYLLASATFDPPPPSAPFNQKGANYVDKVRVESLVGAKPKFVFLRKDGTVIGPEKLSAQFLAQFGQ